MAEHLIKVGADIQATSISSRDNAIHIAASFVRPEILQPLLEKGVDYTHSLTFTVEILVFVQLALQVLI